MPTYECATCQAEGTFSEVIWHTIANHEQKDLSFDTVTLDVSTGTLLKQTTSFGIYPCELANGHTIQPIEESRTIRIVADATHEAESNAPVPDVGDSIEPHDEDTSSADEHDDDLTDIIDQFVQKTPKVLRILNANNKLTGFGRLWDLIYAERFPMNNIATSIDLSQLWFNGFARIFMSSELKVLSKYPAR